VELPASIEVSPNDYRLLIMCSREEVLAAADALMADAAARARDAFTESDRRAAMPGAKDAMATAREKRELAKLLRDYAATV
jgi:hypothetical protein